ncbi:MAG: class I SAM-dependent methyltransferase [Actinomycetota bacterium]|nr:class I SAM-dependent methyltransferase [Actinomycetota bacterium]
MTRIDDPDFVAREYGDESRLAARRRVWNDFLDGENADDAILTAVEEVAHDRVLEVGAGWGEVAARVRDGTGARVIATDLSPRMAALARARDLPTAIADAQSLPFRGRTFDVVVANAMLYHVPDLDRGLDEIARVLMPSGRLVASTFAATHLPEVWELVEGPGVELSFNAENGEDTLRRHFDHVEARLGGGTVTFPNADELRTYVASTITRSHLAERVPDFEGPFAAHSAFMVFVAS